jgi:TRAP-type uncharacterized transport system substrate-binding protein
MSGIPVARNTARTLAAVTLALVTAGGVATAVAQTATQITTGGVTGTYYMIAAPLANYINENSKILRVSPSTSGGGFENLRRVESGQAQFGMTQPETMSQAWNGEKTFAIGAPGSGSTMAMSLFLDHAGMKNDVRIRMEGHQDYPSQLLDGKIQAFSRLGSVPAAVVDEVAASRPINLVDFGPELDRSKFLDKYPFYQKVVVKAGTYKGQDKDVTLFGNAGFLIAHKDVPDELVYEFTRLAYSDGAVRKVDMAFKGANLNRGNPLEGNIGPLHPGAAKFWNELGVKVPAAALK